MNPRARAVDRVAMATIRGLAVALLGLLVLIIGVLVVHGWSELIRPAFYTNAPNIAGPGSGIAPQLFNTVYVLALSLLITVPLGLGAGIYFAEYAAEGRISDAIRRATETLATLPSIIVGLFGYALFIQATHSHPSRLAAALALVVINLPYAVRVSEEAIRAVPGSLREASFALGSTGWQTVSRVLLPAALPALVTGLILIAGRAFGEAAAVLFTGSAGAITTSADFTLSPFAPGDTLAVNLYIFRTQAEPSAVPDAQAYADGVAAFLVLAVLVFNIGARLIGRRVTRRIQGAA